MTTEEKAKAYDEALEKARIYRDNAKAVEEYAAAARYENIFPQLRESEDESIIRAIIDALYSHTNSINLLSSRGYQMENIEAWLEKQKYDRMKPVYDNQDSFESALEKAWKDYNDSGARTVDGCEDNYVECAHAKGFREGYLFGIEKQKEQKPAEWSEEDEKAIEEICNIIVANSKDGYLGRYSAWGLVEKLKSLRPHWKPSEGQIQALEYVVSSIPPNYLKEQEYVMTLIGQVIQQLKKLLYGSTEKVIHKTRED